MSRLTAAALTLIALLIVGGCADNILKERPVTRTAKAPVTKPAFSASSSARGKSSVCGAYRRQLEQTRRALLLRSLAQHRDELRAKELSLNAVIADACE